MQAPFRSYSGDGPYVFVSYSHADATRVFPELQRLRDMGFNVWYDEGISPGESWRGELANAIGNCDTFLIFITPNSAASEHCHREVNFAQTRGRKLLAVHLVQSALSDELEFNLSDRQAILRYNLDDEAYAEKLSERLVSVLDRSRGTGDLSDEPLETSTSSGSDAIPPSWPVKGPVKAAALVVAVLLVAAAPYLVNRGPADEATEEPVQVMAEPADPATQTASDQPALERSIAVLPFDNLSPLAENAFFAAGIHEDLLSSLAKIEQLRVIARKSVDVYADTALSLRQISNELRVGNILQGSVRRAGDQVRISVQLINPQTDQTLWSETYDRQLDDIFAIQSEIAQKITEQLRTSLSIAGITTAVSSPSYNIEAYEVYLQGRVLARQKSSSSIPQAIELFEKATTIQSDFARAHAELTLAMFELGWVAVPRLGGLAMAESHARRALALDPNDSIVLYANARLAEIRAASIGYTETGTRSGPLSDAERYYRAALEGDRNNARILLDFAQFLWSQGRSSEAYEQSLRHLAMDPNSAEANLAIAAQLVDDFRVADAEPYIQRALELGHDALDVRIVAGQIRYNSGDLTGAMQLLDSVLKEDPNHVATLSIAAVNLSMIGEYDASAAFIARIRPLQPLIADVDQAILYNVQGDATAEYAMARQLLASAPTSQMRARLGYAAAAMGVLAAREEDLVRANAYREEALTALEAVLAADIVDGQITITSGNRLSFIMRLMELKQLGQHELAAAEAERYLAFSDRQPQFRLNTGHFFDGIAHLMMDNRARALASFSRIENESPGFYLSYWYDRFGLTNPDIDMYHGIYADVKFQDIVRKAKAREARLREQVRATLPDIADGTAGL
jgi:TolB-like protein/Tfp pilus assembly protein PilF